jgi:YidC/Oxa1 family membrane protein insertase
MSVKKLFLYLSLAFLGSLLYSKWTLDNDPKATQKEGKASSATSFVPPSFQSKPVNKQAKPQHHHPQDNQVSAQQVDVKTDVLSLTIDLEGGNIVRAGLLNYPEALHSKTAVSLFNHEPEHFFIEQSGTTDHLTSPLIFKAKQSHYQLNQGQEALTVLLTAQTTAGLLVTKKYTFTQGRYDIHTDITLKNEGSTPWQGSVYHQFVDRKNNLKQSLMQRSYTGGAISTHDKPYEKITFKAMQKENLNRKVETGWLAMQVPYFVSAWVPDTHIENHYYSRYYDQTNEGKGHVFILGFVSPEISLKPGAQKTTAAQLYVGPEVKSYLLPVAHGLDLTIDYRWVWFLSKPIFQGLSWINKTVDNWGWSIILITIFIKLLFYPLSAKSYRSMGKLRLLAPKIQALREEYGEDKQALGRATMAFYKKEKVNPAGGCLPMLVQIPVFIALYYVLIESVELRQAGFIFWIHDLSVKDPYFILPVLMGLSMLIQQKMSPPPADPIQGRVMMLLPVLMTFFFASFPAGLVLYWITNNCVSILQQWYVMKTVRS